LFFAACGKKNKEEVISGNKDSLYINPDSVQFSFVFMGCNRVDYSDSANANTNASTANVPELQRTFNEVSALNPKPDFFFFLGDLVLGLDKSQPILEKQLAAWAQQYKDNNFSKIAGSGIKMIAIPGNHEMLYMDESTSQEVPWQASLSSWMKIMSPFMPDGPVNRVGGSDSLDNLQTYSFTYKNTHFIMMNTDTYNPALKIGQAPAAWIAADIAKARSNPKVEHIFLMGHKPSYVDAPMTAYDDRLDTSITATIWPAMENNHAEAMLSAHSHQYYRTQPNAGKSYQVIAGNGGSPYVRHIDKDHQFFGYSVIYIMKNGKVIVRSMGRSVPAKSYLESLTDKDSTTIRDQVDISWGTNAPVWNDGMKSK
jgi:hypothetical protein